MQPPKHAFSVVTKGRPRKQVVERYPSGASKRRERGDPRDLGTYNRCKESRSSFWQDRVLESEIGRLHQVQKVLSSGEAEALFELGQHIGRYQRLMGFPRPVARSAAFDLGYSGPSNFAMPAEIERLAGVEKRLNERVRAVCPTEAAWDALYALCAENRHVNPTYAPDIARFARALGGVFANRAGTGKVKRAAPRARRPVEERVAGLVASLERELPEIAEWSLLEGGGEQRGLTGYATDGEQHTVTMHRGDAVAGEFDMAIVRAAQAKGWRERE